ncbi:RNA-guided endonuclease TnpB family protein [Geitlerinema sp. CS-897]|nr:RNA-guided endonuclease TnpB family protein [Geitlerinema sp. CS-897]
MKTLKFKLYNHERNRHLKRMVNASGGIYNHCIALHRRYYRMWGKHLNCAKLQKHIAKLRKRNPFWKSVNAQAAQDICQRIEKAYQSFFKHKEKGVRPPGFKKVKNYKSFTLKQNGYKFLGGNRIKICGRVYQFWKSREIEGKVKTVTIKRTPLGEMFMFVTVDPPSEPIFKVETGKSAGFDFGLKQFLTTSEGFSIDAPLFFKQSLREIQKANRELSRKQKGSNNRERARKNLARRHEDIAHRREDWFWKLAHWLTDRFDVLYFETLNLKAMQRLWGRKVSDLGFRSFLQILEWVAQKKEKVVAYIDRWFPSSKTCSCCGHILDELDLSVRRWRCPSCRKENERDENAAINIKQVGASTCGLGEVSQVQPAFAV